MTRRAPSNYDLLTDIEANLAHAAWIATVIDDWNGMLRSSTTDSGRVTVKGEHPDPAGNAATTDFDRNAQLVASAQLQLDDVERIRVITNRMNARRNGTLNRPSLEQAKHSVNERTTPSTVGWCVACDRHCDGTANSKQLVNKLCNTCRQAELRAWQQAEAEGVPATNRQLHRDQWIKAEHDRRAEQHAS